MFPPVPMTMRRAAKGDYVDGVWIPKGTMFYIAVSGLFRKFACQVYVSDCATARCALSTHTRVSGVKMPKSKHQEIAFLHRMVPLLSIRQVSS